MMGLGVRAGLGGLLVGTALAGVACSGGKDGSSCTVQEGTEGATIACTDGTQAFIGSSGVAPPTPPLDPTAGAVSSPAPAAAPVEAAGVAPEVAPDAPPPPMPAVTEIVPPVPSQDVAAGIDGKDGSSCSVTDDGRGTVTVACTDGTSAELSSGGTGAPGVAGRDGSSCSIRDQGNGRKAIVCEDGTTALLSDGADGADGATGDDGRDGSSCSVVSTAMGAEIRCTDGTSATILDGQNGLDGVDGQDGLDGLDGRDGVDAPEDSTSGSRLTTYSLTGSDGSSYSTETFYDTAIDSPCTISLHAEGTLRCLPTTYQATLTGSYFADEACSSELALDVYDAFFTTPPAYAVRSTLANVDPVPREEAQGAGGYAIYALGPLYTGPVYVRSGSSCTEEPQSGVFYEAGPELSPERFVEFTAE